MAAQNKRDVLLTQVDASVEGSKGPSKSTLPLVSTPTVLLLQMGLNDFVGKFFTKIFQDRGVEVECVKVVENQMPSKTCLDDYDGIVLSGSAYMVTDQHPWSVHTGEMIRAVVERGVTPVLGVCYGHQLLIHTLGGTVSFLEQRQIGSKRCLLTAQAMDDPLFSVFNGRSQIAVHVLHRQSVTSIPEFVTVLARNDVDEYHACRIGPRCWSTQFHPELHTRNLEHVIDAQKDTLAKDGLEYSKVRNSIIRSDDGIMILDRFAKICLSRHRERSSTSSSHSNL